jgi:hypothetical protein
MTYPLMPFLLIFLSFVNIATGDSTAAVDDLITSLTVTDSNPSRFPSHFLLSPELPVFACLIVDTTGTDIAVLDSKLPPSV